MKKDRAVRKLSRKRDQRKALLKALATALILKEKIKTTEAKAKETSRFIEELINRARRGENPEISSGSLLKNKHALYRLLVKTLSPEVAKKLAAEIGPRYKERKGGYTRVIKLGPRKTDGSRMAIVELVK